jgi:hypothetical protein
MNRTKKSYHLGIHTLLVVTLILAIIIPSLTFVADGATATKTKAPALTTISTIRFAGRTWDVSGYDNFANLAQQVWVDSHGYLHMKLSNVSGSWKNVEIVSRDVTGYGTYTWTTDGLKNIDNHIVLGMFAYLDNSHEVDQELSRWNNASKPNFAYTVQPDPVVQGVTQDWFELPTTTLTTVFTTTWAPDHIAFSTTEGGAVVGKFTSNVARDATGVRAIINLWQYAGAPSDGKPVEIVFKDFKFTPITVPSAPTSLKVSQSLGTTTLTWNAPSSNGGSQIIAYEIFRGTTSRISGQVLIGSSTTTSYKDTQVTVGHTYYYSVKAVNIIGVSASSNVVSVLVRGT